MSSYKFMLFLTASLVATAGVAVAQTASPVAATPEPSTVQEVVVTANRRDEKISRVPVSVTAFSKEKMDIQSVRTVDDIVTLTPGIAITRPAAQGNGNQNSISIRGIASAEGAATTGIYIDDTPIQVRAIGGTAANAYPQVFDLQTVEIDRGPQGTLFGAGAEGGTVRFITPQPSLTDYTGYGRAEVAGTDHGGASYEAGAAVGGPIVEDKLGFRVSYWGRHDGGYIDRVDPTTLKTVDKNSNSQNSQVARVALTWSPIPALAITPSLLFQHTTLNDTNFYNGNISNPGSGEFKNERVIAQPTDEKFYLGAVKVKYDLNGYSVINNASVFSRNSDSIYDYTAYDRLIVGLSPYPSLPGENGPSPINNQQLNFTEEFRVQSPADQRLTWVAGVFYSRNRQYTNQSVNNAYFDEVTGIPFTLLPGNGLFKGVDLTHDKQLAGFAQGDLALTSKLKFTAGVRVARTEFNFNQVTSGPLAGGSVIHSSGDQKETPVTPKFGLSYQADPNNMFYVSAAKGYRTGGAQSLVSSKCGPDLLTLGLSALPVDYDSDSVWSYEAGAKSRLFGNMLQLDTSIFRVNWSNIQQRVPLPSCGSAFTANLGEARSQGIDFTSTLHPTRDLALGLTIGYQDSKFLGTEHGGATAIVAYKGDKVGSSGSPFTATATADYTRYIMNYKSYLHVDYEFVGDGPDQDSRAYGYDAVEIPSEAENLLNVRAGVVVGHANVSLFVKNLLNVHPILSQSHDTTDSPLLNDYTVRPLTAGLTATYAF